MHNAQTCGTGSLCQTLLTLREQAGSGLLMLLGLSQQFLKVPIESVKCFFSGVVLQSAGGDQPADKVESDIKAFFSENFPCLQFFSPTTSNETGQQLVNLDIVYSSQL